MEMGLLEQQIEIEKEMTQKAVNKYRNEFSQAVQGETFGTTLAANELMKVILSEYQTGISKYLDQYNAGNAIRSTIAARHIAELNLDIVSYVSAKVVLNSLYSKKPIQALYKAIGTALEDEIKMAQYHQENKKYYEKIQKDLSKRNANSARKKCITSLMFKKKLDFHSAKWTVTEKFHIGMVLLDIFVETTNLFEYENYIKKGKQYKTIVPTDELLNWIENTNSKMELLFPFYLPMVCQPKEWTGIFDGGYISPFIRKNKLIKNNDRNYLKEIAQADMPVVYEAINHLQNTKWQINPFILGVVSSLWGGGFSVGGLPLREDIPLPPFPYPDLKKDDYRTPVQEENIKDWKRKTYEIHKTNVKTRSLRFLAETTINIAERFSKYDSIWFPYQMDFRGRMYPIPVLLQPQGTDLAKGLLRFSQGRKCDKRAIEWLKIHGANVFGYDKASYTDRVKWVDEHQEEILAYAKDPLTLRGWADADKPFQFLAFCFEWAEFVANPEQFKTRIPIQLDGTCNGLQHYSALLKDEIAGKAVNLINAEIPSDIYAKVAEKLERKLNELQGGNNSRNSDMVGVNNNKCCDMVLAKGWLDLGINRKLTKRPVMVLPYGGTQISCREYISLYLTENYSGDFLWNHFKIGNSPPDCVYKVSCWLGKYLWDSIRETVKAAIVGMDYLRKVARVVTKHKQPLRWITPVGLLIQQGYKTQKNKEIRTELYGKCLRTNMRDNTNTLDTQHQLNGVCPNFIHSLDAACLMKYLCKCKAEGINAFMTVHDCYGVPAPDTDKSAQLLREAFVEIYHRPLIDDFTVDVTLNIPDDIDNKDLPEKPECGKLNVDEVLKSAYFFN